MRVWDTNQLHSSDERRTGSAPAVDSLHWIAALYTLAPKHNSYVDVCSCARIHVCLPSLSSDTWKRCDRVVGRDPGDEHKPRSCKLLPFFLASASAQTNTPTHTHTARPRSVATGRGSRDSCFEEAHSTTTARPTNGRGDSALCMSNDWQHVGLLTRISHGEFVTCSCSPLGWCEVKKSVSVCQVGGLSRVQVTSLATKPSSLQEKSRPVSCTLGCLKLCYVNFVKHKSLQRPTAPGNQPLVMSQRALIPYQYLCWVSVPLGVKFSSQCFCLLKKNIWRPMKREISQAVNRGLNALDLRSLFLMVYYARQLPWSLVW